MTPPDLLVHLACIPETLPAGLPLSRPPGRLPGGMVLGAPCAAAAVPGWRLNLSPPPTDAEGRPTRLDAFDWAADTLSSRFGEPDMRTAGYALQTMIAHMMHSEARNSTGRIDMNTPRYWYRQWVERGGADFLAGVDVFDMKHPRRKVVAMGLRARVGLEGGEP